jgi:CubicO group peptidase (beta-lactamase class C family)
MLLLKSFTFLVFITLITGSLAGTGFTPEKIKAIDGTLQSWVDTEKYAGIINLTSVDGAIEHFKAYGYSDLNSKSRLKKDSIVRIYSMTKPIVSVALMQLIEKGEVALEDSIVLYFPELKGLTVYQSGEQVALKRPITVKHLLTHTAGFSYGWSEHPVDAAYRGANMFSFMIKDSDAFVKTIAQLPLIYQPGEKWHYSIAVDLQGILIERLSGMPLDQYLDKYFFKPLGMVDTGFHVPISKKERFTTNYKNIENRLTVEDPLETSRYYKKRTFFSGGGGLVSTASDYLKFAQMLLNGGIYDGKRFLSESTIQMMTRDHLSEVLDNPNDPWSEFSFPLADSTFGLGFRLKTIVDAATGDTITKQYSWNGAAGTEFWIDPVESLINVTLIQKMDSDWKLRENMEQLIY